MDKKTRLETTFNLENPDQAPIMVGWLAAPNHIQTLTGCSEDEYWGDPFSWGIKVEQVLGSDGDPIPKATTGAPPAMILTLVRIPAASKA